MPNENPPSLLAALIARIQLAVDSFRERVGPRITPGQRASAAMGVAAVIAALVAGWWVFSGRPSVMAVSPTAFASPATAGAAAGAGASAGAPRPANGVPVVTPPVVTSSATATLVLVIDIVGRVARPGVYRLPAGSRVDDALRLAGGALPGVDLTQLNLASKVSDGQQIAVGVPGAPADQAGAGASGEPAGTAGPLDLNTATAEQLDALPGVGPVLAQHIVAWRQAHGRFDSVDQLREVSGVGPAKYDDLRPLVTV
ncbi:MAG TPA: ComEA family DNA-binding protein [Jatrophihabitantaceae bacterium]|nr:ComEA family DNA-binding protein [Jatrophihabitantaceae bacterium]